MDEKNISKLASDLRRQHDAQGVLICIVKSDGTSAMAAETVDSVTTDSLMGAVFRGSVLLVLNEREKTTTRKKKST